MDCYSSNCVYHHEIRADGRYGCRLARGVAEITDGQCSRYVELPVVTREERQEVEAAERAEAQGRGRA